MAGAGGSCPVRDPAPSVGAGELRLSSPASTGLRALRGRHGFHKGGVALSPRPGASPRDPAGASPPPASLAPKATAPRPGSEPAPFSVTAGALGQGLMKKLSLVALRGRRASVLELSRLRISCKSITAPPGGPGPLPPRAVSCTGAWTPPSPQSPSRSPVLGAELGLGKVPGHSPAQREGLLCCIPWGRRKSARGPCPEPSANRGVLGVVAG